MHVRQLLSHREQVRPLRYFPATQDKQVVAEFTHVKQFESQIRHWLIWFTILA